MLTIDRSPDDLVAPGAITAGQSIPAPVRSDDDDGYGGQKGVALEKAATGIAG
jgi:hypothetical protein